MSDIITPFEGWAYLTEILAVFDNTFCAKGRERQYTHARGVDFDNSFLV